MKHSCIIAIDPGASGAAVVRSADGPIIAVVPFDGLESIRTALTKGSMSPSGSSRTGAYIERVWASPVMGKSACFAFGVNYGLWLGALAAHGIPVVEVTPQVWQKHLNLESMGKDRKAELKNIATLLYGGDPNVGRVTLTNCDALLLSGYARAKNLEDA